MKNFFKWLLVAYLITVPLIIFFASMSILTAMAIWFFYMPACGILLLLLEKGYKSIGVPSSARVSMHILMAIGLFAYPTWDGFVGKYYLKKICLEYGGVYVTPGLRIDSLYVDLPISEKSIGDISSADDLEKLKRRIDGTFFRMKKSIGFSMLERPVKDKNYYVQIYSFDGKNMTIKLSSDSISRFEESYSEIDLPREWKNEEILSGLSIRGSSVFFMDRKTKEKVAWFNDYYFPQRFDGFWSAVGGSGSASCKGIYSGNENYKLEKLFELILENNK